MPEDEPQPSTHSRQHAQPRPRDGGTSRMHARTWTLAACYAAPEDYDIPRLPEWTVYGGDGRGVAFAAPDETEPFISAETPVRVRR